MSIVVKYHPQRGIHSCYQFSSLRYDNIE